MNARFTPPVADSVIPSLRNSANIAERVGCPTRAEHYRRMADTAEQFDAPWLYRHFADEAAVWAAGQVQS